MRVNLTVTDDALVVSGLPGPRDEPPDLPDAGTIDLGDGVTVRATDAGFEVAGLPAPTATDAGGLMPTPRGPFWRNPGEAAWRRTASDPPPAPPTSVEWLIAHPASRGERGLHPPGIENRAANRERADQVGPQLP